MAVVGNGVILPRMLEQLAHPDLRWLAEFDLVFHGKPASSGQPHFMHLHRRPVLVYGKGAFRTGRYARPVGSPAPGGAARGHDRAWAAMTVVLERFCRPGQTVCDPVMLDRAGTALAARRLGCTFVGGGSDRNGERAGRPTGQWRGHGAVPRGLMGRRRFGCVGPAHRSPGHWPGPGVRTIWRDPEVRESRLTFFLDTQPRPIRWTTPLLMGRFKLAAVKSKRIPDPGVWGQFKAGGLSRFCLVRNMEIPRCLVATSRPSARRALPPMQE